MCVNRRFNLIACKTPQLWTRLSFGCPNQAVELDLEHAQTLAEDGDGFSVGLALKFIALLLKDQPEFGAVGDDTVVDDHELGSGVGPVGMAVRLGGRAVSGPSSVSDGDLAVKSLGYVDRRGSDLLAKRGHFSDLFEEYHVFGGVAVDNEPSGIIPTVFLTSQTVTEDLKDVLPALLLQKIAISEESTHDCDRTIILIFGDERVEWVD